MSSKMLIDASHPEETRVVVLKGNRVEEFDFESANKKQLRGNIYLAKVTRVEPSLQAAFVEYGGNRHGFLAFSEIHPDYYQIPHADRQALLEEEARAHRDDEDEPRGDEGRSGERNARSDRGDRGGRSDRGERSHRRSRRHRRDGSVPLDRRGPADESVSEPAGDLEPLTEAIGFDGDGQVAAVSEPLADGAPAEGRAGADPVAEADVRADAPSPHEALSDAEAPSSAEADAAVEEAVAVEPTSVSERAPRTETAPPVEGGERAAVAAEPEPGEPVAETAAEPAEEATAAAGEPEFGAPAAEADEPATFEGGEVEARRTEDEHDDEDESEEAGHEPARTPAPEQVGGDALEDAVPRATRPRRHYKIQEVIKRRQILLVQVVKEERGNKGAALTTYLSLAGRYSVLMPNTARGGGISRKITDGEDRKRLKAIAGELDVPEGMGVILRTAGASRSNQEVKRDFEYLLRMWESVRELTLKSTAPTLVYEEGSLIKRSIRDLYSKEVEDVIVAGDEGFAEARDFMRMLMPGNVKFVQLYRDPQPIFAKSGVEAQLDAMFSNHVTLRSGGYLVINQTEALVAIDVNSGRSTREHNIEDTALRTNLEAADEVARQLRLRDLAGLIVVDFIDMEEGRNNRAVERRMKDALKNDRARIQVGHISHFGLMEMSRQRIRTGVFEGSTVVCPHCAGSGSVRSTASIALHVLRLAEDALIRDASHDIVVRTRTEVALYVLNQKRTKLIELEQRFGVTITVMADPTLTGMVYHAIERGELATPAVAPVPRRDLVRVDSVAPIFDEDEEDVAEVEGDDEADTEAGSQAASADEGEGGRRRRRRRRRRGRDRESTGVAADGAQPSDEGMATMAEIGGDMPAEFDAPEQDAAPAPLDAPILPFGADFAEEGVSAPGAAAPDEPTGEEPALPAEEEVEPAPRRRRSRRAAAAERDEAQAPESEAPAAEDAGPVRRRRRPARSRSAEAAAEPQAKADAEGSGSASSDAAPAADAAEAPAAATERLSDGAAPPVDESPVLDAAAVPADERSSIASSVVPSPEEPVPAPSAEEPEAPEPDRPKRSGWWQRAKASFGG